MLGIGIRQLEAFVAAAEYENFTKAGEMLHLTQSTVSIHVQSLEETLGTRLIVRGSRTRFTLTEDGKRVYAAAKDILSRCEALEHMHFEAAEDTLSVAASTVPAVSLVPGLAGGFIRRRPDVKYLFKRGDSEHVFALLSAGDARIGFAGMEPDGRLFRCRPVAEDTLVLISANTETYRARRDGGAFAEELTGLPMLCREEGSATQRKVDSYLRQLGIGEESMRIKARVDNPETLIGMVADGAGVAVVSTVAAEKAVSEGRVLTFPFRDGGLKRFIYAVWRRDIPLTQTEHAFLKYVFMNAPYADGKI